jgi:TRAP-type C4-dicarboxylate transport system permease small subunit
MKWVTPAFLFTLLGWWTYTEAGPTLLMQTVTDPETIPYRWVSRLLIVAMVAVTAILVRRAWALNGHHKDLITERDE